MKTVKPIVRQLLRRAWLLVLIQPCACNATVASDETGSVAGGSIESATLAVIVNDADPLSRRIGDYYAQQRHIPENNLIHVSFAAGKPGMTRGEFQQVMATVNARVSPSVQAYALTWTEPYRVGCMSITTAFAAGYDEAFCARGCKATRPSPYFSTDSRRPHEDYGWRPAMLLAGRSFDDVKGLIDRGVAADGTRPPGTGYLVSTKDAARNVRSRFYPGIVLMQSDRFDFKLIYSNTIRYRTNIMFYFTGLARVSGIDTNRFLPGAVADHLTSSGGQLTDSKQMSSLRWLEAGATGSYGTVVEPCAFTQKFPRPDIVVDRYLNGETLLEAYWKSVAWPGQGVFIGEPLAAPFREKNTSLQRGEPDSPGAKPGD
ncbi:MAG: TIGR03790 family protein [Gammaproteobacteria bacterium]